jgi:hypothetical protein
VGVWIVLSHLDRVIAHGSFDPMRILAVGQSAHGAVVFETCVQRANSNFAVHSIQWHLHGRQYVLLVIMASAEFNNHTRGDIFADTKSCLRSKGSKLTATETFDGLRVVRSEKLSIQTDEAGNVLGVVRHVVVDCGEKETKRAGIEKLEVTKVGQAST